MSKKYKFALDTVSIREGGSKYPTVVPRGSAWHSEHPLVLANPAVFGDDPPDVLPREWKAEKAEKSVEQATAAPGEKRAAKRAN